MWLVCHRWIAWALALVASAIGAIAVCCWIGAWGAESATRPSALTGTALAADVDPAAVPQPDLRPEPPRYLEDTSDPCALTWVVGMVLYVSNQGTADAGPFEFTVNSTPYAVPAGLMEGQIYQVQVREWPWNWLPSGNYDIIVDSQNQITESDEENNRLIGVVPMVTPRASCTPSVSPTFSPTATSTATPPPLPPKQQVCLPILWRGYTR